jgi:hypothetical protein
MIARIILPHMRENATATRRRHREMARKIKEFLPLDRHDGPAAAGVFGVILLTVTA